MPLLNDTTSYPPTVGVPDSFNSDIRPGQGSTYAGSRFGTTFRQLSNTGSYAFGFEGTNYAHCLINADGTLYLNYVADSGFMTVGNFQTGAYLFTSEPADNRSDLHWHPTDATKYLYFIFSGGSRGLWERTVGVSSALVKDFGADLLGLGGSHNFCDKTGRYYIFADAGGVGVYDRTSNVIFTGRVTNPSAGGGYATISSDGNFVITSDGHFRSYALDKINHVLNTTAVMFWGPTTDHGMFVTDSGGQSYGIVTDNQTVGGLYRVTVDRDRSGFPTTTGQIAENIGVQKVLDTGAQWANIDALMTHGPNGAGQHWFFAGLTTYGGTHPGEDFNGTPSSGNWWLYAGELLAINYKTLDILRLDYHRSRGISPSDPYGPYVRPTCAWDSSALMWNSNFNQQIVTQYADLYGIQSPLGAAASGNFFTLIFK